MAETKKYYWLKLRNDFINGDIIDFLMSQKDGANYVVLYLKMCTMVMNTNGILATEINEVIFPYDVDKIQRDCKFFNQDTIIVALELFKKLGLVYVNENDVFQIANYDMLVGSETSKAEIMRRKRKFAGNIVTNLLPSPSNIVTEEKEYRDKSIDIDLDHRKNKEHEEKSIVFFPYSKYPGTDPELIKDVKRLFDTLWVCWEPAKRGKKADAQKAYEQAARAIGIECFVDSLEKGFYSYFKSELWAKKIVSTIANWMPQLENFVDQYNGDVKEKALKPINQGEFLERMKAHERTERG